MASGIPNYYLVASGGGGVPRISHAIFANAEKEAIEEAIRVIRVLHPRYWIFALNDSEGKTLHEYEVKQPNPVVWNKKDLPGCIRF